MHVNLLSSFVLNRESFDGETLCMLKNNFDEFKQLVPQSGLRIKIKGLIDAGANNPMLQV